MDTEENELFSEYMGVYREIAEKLGEQTAREMFDHFAGLQVTFPKKLYTVEYLSQKVKLEYAEGLTVRELSKKYGYTERRIRQFLDRESSEENVGIRKK